MFKKRKIRAASTPYEAISWTQINIYVLKLPLSLPAICVESILLILEPCQAQLTHMLFSDKCMFLQLFGLSSKLYQEPRKNVIQITALFCL